MTLRDAQLRLAALWLCGSGVIFLLMVADTLGGAFGSKTKDAWQWFTPTVVPTLSLVVTVVTANEIRPPPTRNITRFFFRATWWLSATYLLLALITLLATIRTDVVPKDRFFERKIDVLRDSNLYLGLMQGLVASTLGVFFVKADHLAASVSSAGPRRGKDAPRSQPTQNDGEHSN